MNAKLFEYAIIWNPNGKQSKKGQKPKILVAPTTILQKSAEEVGVLAAREIPSKYLDQLEQIDIAVRPF